MIWNTVERSIVPLSWKIYFSSVAHVFGFVTKLCGEAYYVFLNLTYVLQCTVIRRFERAPIRCVELVPSFAISNCLSSYEFQHKITGGLHDTWLSFPPFNLAAAEGNRFKALRPIPSICSWVSRGYSNSAFKLAPKLLSSEQGTP